MKRLELKRRFSAWTLLAILVPMLLLAALHTHDVSGGAVETCVECANHQPHGGHLTAATQLMTDCVLCQLFSLQYLETACCVVLLAAALPVLVTVTTVEGCTLQAVTSLVTRGPPYFF